MDIDIEIIDSAYTMYILFVCIKGYESKDYEEKSLILNNFVSKYLKKIYLEYRFICDFKRATYICM